MPGINSLGTLSARVALDTTPLSAGLKTAGVAFAAVAAGAAAAIYKVGSSYQDSLNTFQAVSQASAAEMSKVAAAAKTLGADLTLPATSAADAAKAMTELAKAGLSVDESLAAAKGTLQLAAAAQVDEAKAAEIAANALNAFGLKGSEAGRVADILAASANASSAEITDMADALKMSSAVFAAANIPIEDLAAALGEMANKGIKGSDAGTSLKQMLLSLEGPSKAARAALNDMGIKVYDTTGKMNSFRSIIGQFSGALSKMTQQQRDQALATIFGSDAVRAANVIFGEGTEGFDKMREAVTRVGAAQEVATAKSKGLRGALDGLKSQLETVAISIYEKVAPGLERIVRAVAEGVPGAITKMRLLADSFARAGEEGVTSDGLFGVAERLGVAFARLVALAKEHWPAIRDAVVDFVTSAVSIVQAHWPEIERTITEVATTVQAVIAGVVDSVQTIWRNFGEQIVDVTRAAWKFVVESVEGSATMLRGIVQAFTAILHGDWSALWNGLGDIVEGWNQRMDALLRLGMSIIGETISAGWEVIKAAFLSGTAFIVDKFMAAVEWILRGAATAFSWVPGVGPKLREAAEKFEQFRDEANAALRGVEDRTVTVDIDASQAYRTIDDLRSELASVNAQISDSGPGGGRGAARNDLEERIADQESAPTAQLDQYALGMDKGPVRGPLGRPRVILAHGGEWVVTPEQLRRIRSAAAGLRRPVAAGTFTSTGVTRGTDGGYAGPSAAEIAVAVAKAIAANPVRATVSASAIAEGLSKARRP